MKEFELIESLRPFLHNNPQTLVGAGDDCAVLDVGIPGRLLLFKTDAVVENVHFTRESGWERIGRKAIGRCLSDIAAMAGIPISALVTLGLPSHFDPNEVKRIYVGLNERAAEFDVSISGGETVCSEKGVFLSISMLGSIPRNRLLLRSNMQINDAVFVTGELGGSLKEKHLDFSPRVKEAQWLAENFEVHALMDISDGLAGDLRRLMDASEKGVQLLAEAIPVSRSAKEASREEGGKSPLTRALSDGEDFELLFTVPASSAVELLDKWKIHFPLLKLSCIGKVILEKTIKLLSRKTGLTTLDCHGYDHFQ
ncbi:MAG: thiamine-monophosphate kinase [Verrucomicrobia bacterium]|nr:thiamine-monophosphate kinase [Verrucomicrobiota bacterium]